MGISSPQCPLLSKETSCGSAALDEVDSNVEGDSAKLPVTCEGHPLHTLPLCLLCDSAFWQVVPQQGLSLRLASLYTFILGPGWEGSA